MYMEMTDMSGWQQSPTEIRTPSSLEIAIVSGRICRYAGNLPCTLLTHIMVGARLVWYMMRSRPSDARLETFAWWMLHDTHETITGDFVFEHSEAMLKWQDEIDAAIAAVYGINPMLVEAEIIREADLFSRWLEAKHYGSDKFFETMVEHYDHPIPPPEMERKTVGIFRSPFGKMSGCALDENNTGVASLHPVSVYAGILDNILRGNKKGAVEYYDGMVVELGLDS